MWHAVVEHGSTLQGRLAVQLSGFLGALHRSLLDQCGLDRMREDARRMIST